MALISWRRVRRNQVVDTELIQLLFNNDKALEDFVVGFTATTSDHTTRLDTLQGQIATLEPSVASAVADAGAAVADASAALAASSAATATANAASNAATQAITTAEQANATAIAANNAAVAAQAAANNAASDAAAALANSITAQSTASSAATTAAQAASDAAAATATANSAATDAAQAYATVSALQTTVGALQSSVNNHETRIVNLESGGGGGGVGNVIRAFYKFTGGGWDRLYSNEGGAYFPTTGSSQAQGECKIVFASKLPTYEYYTNVTAVGNGNNYGWLCWPNVYDFDDGTIYVRFATSGEKMDDPLGFWIEIAW